MKKPLRRVALLVELPAGLENAQLAALRRFLKVLVRTYGIRCLSVLPPNETRTFGSHAANNASIAVDPTVDCLATIGGAVFKNDADAKPAGLAKPKKRKQSIILKGMIPR